MSKFKTTIPVDVAGRLKLLPEGAHVHGTQWNPEIETVDLIWEHDRFQTGRDFPVEFPQANLAEQKLPEGVKLLAPAQIVERSRVVAPSEQKPATGEQSPPAGEQPPAKPPVTEQDIERSLAEGQQAIEAAKARIASPGSQLSEPGPVETPEEAAKKQPGEGTLATAQEVSGAAPETAAGTAVPPVVRTEPEKTVERKPRRK